MHARDLDGSPSTLNNSGMDDPEFNELNDALYSWENIGNFAVINELAKRKNQVILENITDLALPKPYLYFFWQPWIKGYGGSYTIGEQNRGNFPMFMWVDQELKKEMGY